MGRKMLVLGASMWVEGERGWKDRRAWQTLGLSGERNQEWESLTGKRSVPGLRTQDTWSSVSFRIDIQKTAKLLTKEIEVTTAQDGLLDELAYWQFSKKGSVVKAGLGTANKQTNPMWANASKTEEVEDSLAANRSPGVMKEGIVLCLPMERTVFLHLGRISYFHRAQIFGESCFILHQLKLVGWNGTDQRTLTSLGLSFWTELRDSLLSLNLVRTSFWGRMGWEEALWRQASRLKGTTFL